ncbi:hypothetical protein FRC06_006286 [Ceratobasidium sp. 370]|nr:hypothetical protein FRC06_006286 [Ceratobasidium sp. 370]
MNACRSGDRWPVGLAPRALKELQKFKRDRSSLDIVWKKVKELSAGQFTVDNCAAIIGTIPKIPIYRARLSNDLRIIYHVDVVSDKAEEYDHQGKTTALIYKMQSMDQSATTPIRQLFVTRSRVLAKHVESSFSRLVDSLNMESEVAEELGETPTELDQALVEFDNEVDLRNDLPSQFSLLEDSHFPLFLCSLIEADIYEKQKEETLQVWSAKPMWQRTIIGYKEFKEIYWPQFKSSDRSGLNPSLVYSEILGVIKGYSEVMECTNGYLNQDQYVWGGVAHKVSAHLDTSVKRQIYSMFEDYRRLKGGRLELDQADRSHHIFKFFADPNQQAANICLASIDFLYVDEVQDNLMTDIRRALAKSQMQRTQKSDAIASVLREICKSVDNTYWGGDTAQTILAGSAFRIKDLGSYLYTELHESIGNNRRRLPSSLAPTRFELTVNYRSHAGIVGCAASIVDSLYSLFPESLDRLARETAHDESTEYLPVVLTDTSSDVSAFENFLLKST